MGALTAQHPSDPTPLTAEDVALLTAFDNGYRDVALVFQGWPNQINFHLGNDPALWLPDYIHASQAGLVFMGCGVLNYMVAKGFF